MTYQFEWKDVFGDKIPLIKVDPPYSMLNDLSNGFLSDPEGVSKVIGEINLVIDGESPEYSFGGSDYCIIECHSTECKIYYDFGENEAAIKTDDLVSLLQDWRIFLGSLKKY